MSRSTPIRLIALALALFALTFATIRVVGGPQSQVPSPMDAQVALSELTVPVEIIETGEAPATVEVRVRP